MKTFNQIQKKEAATWLIPNEKERREKAQRESIRYPLLKKQMGLDHLDTSDMIVFDIGAGPLGGVSSLLNAKEILRFDPLVYEYSKYYPCTNYLSDRAESLEERLSDADLIIVTNAMDHFEDPELFLGALSTFMKRGAFFAHLHAQNNALTHPHPAHVHNINPDYLNYYLKDGFETVWYLDYKTDGLTYGWRKQPAFSGLYRKVNDD